MKLSAVKAHLKRAGMAVEEADGKLVIELAAPIVNEGEKIAQAVKKLNAADYGEGT